MKIFNAFQTVTFFAVLQFGLGWVSGQDFWGADVALWGGAVVYLATFAFMVAAVNEAFEKGFNR